MSARLGADAAPTWILLAGWLLGCSAGRAPARPASELSGQTEEQDSAVGVVMIYL